MEPAAMGSPTAETSTMKASTVETTPVKPVRPSAIEKRTGAGVRSKGAEIPRRVEAMIYMGCPASGKPGPRMPG